MQAPLVRMLVRVKWHVPQIQGVRGTVSLVVPSKNLGLVIQLMP